VRHFEVVDAECVGCNLCMHVCPVDQCITMERVDAGAYTNWTTHPNNPLAVTTATPETAAATGTATGEPDAPARAA